METEERKEFDFNKPHCLKTQTNKPFMINRKVSEIILTDKLIKEGVEIGDYMCQWIEKNKPMTAYYKYHQITECKGSNLLGLYKS